MAEPTALPADAAVREEALDPAGSFIVQAPAGSGKTELLIQRLLVLLAAVERPEEVLAITFTRKAAAEMRARLLDALTDAADGEAPAPQTPHEVATRGRARAVLARDAAQGWNLLESPGRLRIQTIDSLCAALTRERPVGSGLGEPAAIAEEPNALYEAAARSTLAALEGEGTEAAAVERLLLHLDGNHARAQELLATLLARRDQWMRHLAPGTPPDALRPGLEAALRAAVDEALQATAGALHAAAAGLDVKLDAELAALAPHAAAHVARGQPEAPIARLGGLRGLPPPEADALALWQGLAELLTTGERTWRKRLDRRTGFPVDPASGDEAALRAMKTRATALLQALAGAPAAGERLAAARALPPPAYTDAQWAVLEALLTLLPRAVERLGAAFGAAGEMDYAEVALAAVRALERGGDGAADGEGAEGATLREDARHVLVDEFQDTSHGQFRLLEGLTAGWPADGTHTLFLVGDPMQSIYRFREADVGLFLRARRVGIGLLRPRPLTLKVNFRSTEGLVRWVNEVFPAVLPAAEDVATGAVPFVAASPHRGVGEGPAVAVHPLLQETGGRERVEAEEGRRVAEIVAEARARHPGETVAVLVRTRGHLRGVLPALQRAGLAFQAVEIEALAERPEVQDLLALTRALAHPGDGVAWLAVLRAPWCGLELADLLHLAGPAPRQTLWERMTDATVTAGLGETARTRVARVVAALGPALAQRARRAPRRWVEGAWLGLGGPACVPPAALRNIEAYLARLETLPSGEPPGGPEALAALLKRLYAAPDPQADARLQVMSIHRAKGLQFDTVIVPGLGRAPRHDEPPLLRWLERPLPTGAGTGLLLAPIHETGPQRDSVYDFLAGLEQHKADHETGRLLYVAVTRARRALHLLGHAVRADDGLRQPHRASLLARLWPALAPAFETRAAQDAPADPERGDAAPLNVPAPSMLQRLPAGWQAPSLPAGVALPPQQPEAQAAEAGAVIEFRWAGESARHVGTVVHRLLRLIARHGPARWQAGAGAFSREGVSAALGAQGLAGAEREAAATRVLDALARTLADERGRWVLAPHAEARSEYALTARVDGRPVHSVIDRTFVDEGGVRWIVDFKTGGHEGGDVEAFLDREQERYRAQLERYAAALARLEPGRPIRLALYFPLLQAWREWAPAGAQPALPSARP